MSGSARNSKKECAGLAAGQAVLTAERITSDCSAGFGPWIRRPQKIPHTGIREGLARDGVLNRARVGNALGSFEYFEAHDVAILVVVEDDPRLILVAFLDGSVA